jgi:hypothetical protein
MSENTVEVIDAPVVTTPATSTAVIEVPIELPPLSVDEDSFCLAIIEYSGNASAAYRSVFGDVTHAAAKANRLLSQPNIQLRIRALTESIQESSIFTMTSHLMELASIRDMAKLQGQLKVALQAERSRGEVSGLYKQQPQTGPTMVQVNMVSKYDMSI